MTENEAKRQIKEHLVIAGCEDLFCDVEALETAIQALEEIQQYRAIGTIDEFKALKEKNEPKKPDGISKEYGDYFGSCPICNRSAINYLNMPYKYCPKCGQKLDWQ